MSYSTPCAVSADLRRYEDDVDRGDREQEYIDEVLKNEQATVAMRLMKSRDWLPLHLAEDFDAACAVRDALQTCMASGDRAGGLALYKAMRKAAMATAKELLESACEEYFEYPNEKGEITADSVSIPGVRHEP